MGFVMENFFLVSEREEIASALIVASFSLLRCLDAWVGEGQNDNRACLHVR